MHVLASLKLASLVFRLPLALFFHLRAKRAFVVKALAGDFQIIGKRLGAGFGFAFQQRQIFHNFLPNKIGVKTLHVAIGFAQQIMQAMS